MTKERSRKRFELLEHLRVFDAETKTLLGYVKDLNMEGMMLLGDEHVPADQDFRLWLELPPEQPDGRGKAVELRAHSLWSSIDVNPKYYATGFRLAHPSVKTVERIKTIIKEFSV